MNIFVIGIATLAVGIIIGFLLHALYSRTQMSTEKLVAKLDQVNQHISYNNRELETQLAQVHQLSSLTHKQSQSISRAFTTSKTRGKWGELQLERIIELAGMTKYCDYSTQTTNHDSNNKPDLIVHLPHDRYLIIDSKAPYDQYELALEDQENWSKYMDRVILNIKHHIQLLSRKEYWADYKGKSPDFVFMFIPIDSLYLAALEHEPNLIEFAYQRKIIIVNPASLLTSLHVCALTWQNVVASEEAEEIRQIGLLIREETIGLTKDITNLGNNLKTACTNYNHLVSNIRNNLHEPIEQLENLESLPKNKSKVIYPKKITTNLDLLA